MQSVILAAALLLAQAPSSEPTASGARTVEILPSGWLVLPHAPPGWDYYTDRASEVGADLYYLPVGETFDQNGSLIRVQILTKDFGDDVHRDLASDMARFKAKTPDIRFLDFAAVRPGGSVYGRIYRFQQHDEYVAYVDPNSHTTYFFIISLDSAPGYLGSDRDIGAYRNVIKTFARLGRIR